MCLTGCVSVPTESVTPSITADELAQHVDFLTQPALRGRPARSHESKIVRDYLTERLTRYGCIPWKDTESFELDFGFGTNVIGVLPGSDPELSKETILVSAHYDHLKPKLFSYYPGACDNAASVAVLLELAEKLSQAKNRPKRSICFAFFDAEEQFCLGSFAFTCRDDYKESDIAAVVNMDLMGRNLLDVVDNCFVTVGTENYPQIHSKVSAACGQNNLKLIPFESALIGPASDHTAFTLVDRPVLFFTCGINKDYHQPTDTPDKIDYDKLLKENAVIEQAVLSLANAEAELFERTPSQVTPEKTESFSYILSKFKEHQEELKLDPNDIKTLDELIVKTDDIDPNTITHADLVALQRDALGDLLKLLKNYNPTLFEHSEHFIEFGKFYSINPREFVEISRKMIQHYLNNKPTLFGKNEFAYQDYLPITETSWGLTKIEEDQYLFGFIDLEIAAETRLQILTGASLSLDIHYKLTTCKGSLDEIIEYACLGGHHPSSQLVIETTHHFGPKDKKASPDSDNTLLSRQISLRSKLLKTIEQEFPEETTSPIFQKYKDPDMLLTDPNGADPFNNVSDIFLTPSDFEEPNKKKKVKKNKDKLQAQLIAILNDTSQHIENRVGAVGGLKDLKTEISLTAIAEVLDEATLYEHDPRMMSMMLRADHPLRHHPIVDRYVSGFEEKDEKYKGKTLGQIAYEQLKEATKKDFGQDKEAWKKWIKKRYR
jgi:hypothetical protein